MDELDRSEHVVDSFFVRDERHILNRGVIVPSEQQTLQKRIFQEPRSIPQFSG